MKSKLLVLAVLMAALTAPASAQSPAGAVTVKPREESYSVKRGSSSVVGIAIKIKEGYHINSNRPRDKFLIATVLKIERESGLVLGPVRYPKPKMQKFSFSDKPLSVYEGEAILTFSLRASATATSGNHTLHGKLTVQACNDEQCLRPQTLNVDIPVAVVQ